MTGGSYAIVGDKKPAIGKDPAPRLCNTVWGALMFFNLLGH